MTGNIFKCIVLYVCLHSKEVGWEKAKAQMWMHHGAQMDELLFQDTLADSWPGDVSLEIRILDSSHALIGPISAGEGGDRLKKSRDSTGRVGLHPCSHTYPQTASAPSMHWLAWSPSSLLLCPRPTPSSLLFHFIIFQTWWKTTFSFPGLVQRHHLAAWWDSE